MDVFRFRDDLIAEYSAFVQSFVAIRDPLISAHVEEAFRAGALWPEALVQLNPSFERGAWIDELVKEGVLHPECARIFRKDRGERGPDLQGTALPLHRHQEEAIRIAARGKSYVLTTGTGSGKSLAYIVPIVDHVLRRGSGRGIQAIVVYPMNALANSQVGELEKFLCMGFPKGAPAVTFARYTGQEGDAEKQAIVSSPPDILLTNYVMLELLLTRPKERKLVESARGLRFLVLDELHTYRGRQGADVALLSRRVREALGSDSLQFVGTSATLAGPGSLEAQRAEVARVASALFGTDVKPGNVVGETLRRLTPLQSPLDVEFLTALRQRVADAERKSPTRYQPFIEDPLSSWIESTFGLTPEVGTGRLTRARPRPVFGDGGAAEMLAEQTGLPVERCADAIREALLAGSSCERNPDTGFPPFAFRLHQLVSRGDTVFASIEAEPTRHITLAGQRFVPGHRDRLLMPLVFCRDCGQEYYSVWRVEEEGIVRFEPRPPSERTTRDDGKRGYLYLTTDDERRWPEKVTVEDGRAPEDWFEERKDGWRLKSARRDDLPVNLDVLPDGNVGSGGEVAAWVPSPFRFCLGCGVTFGGRGGNDYPRLGTLGTEGRSSATTILSLHCIRQLRGDETLEPKARKLLSFTDNRQDASLQAGHFNDFVEIAILRAGLYRAVANAGAAGVRDEDLTQRVFEALGLPLTEYASNPEARFRAREDTDRALREVIGYRIFRDLKRGWRIVAPNLEQCGLLEIRYRSLEDLCGAADVWQGLDPCLVDATPARRAIIARTLLDFMRRELCLKVRYLDRREQETIRNLSFQHLRAPWSVDEAEADQMEHSRILFPRPQKPDDTGESTYLSGRGGFGQFLRRRGTFEDGRSRPKDVPNTEVVIRQLLGALSQAGLVEVVSEEKGEVKGYQVPSAALLWTAPAEGSVPVLHDPVRIPRPPKGGLKPNLYFQHVYRSVALAFKGLQAREHTAQVLAERRLEREAAFRQGTLPVLYCSPTMELGVDIAELNVVNMRNVPPTPANYAQRSGRAGRSGQPAFVLSYCATGNAHDQYFFRRPELMVAGAVSPPRLDLSNEDLIRAHLHAIWLSETGADLGRSLGDILDLEGDEPSLELQPAVAADLANTGARARARERALRVLSRDGVELAASSWYSPEWLDSVLSGVERQFQAACSRWRGLYRTALGQSKAQSRVILDHSRPETDRIQARRLRAEAESQLRLLASVEQVTQSDFFSYRYFASEGFLPGYSFPRLPLSAFIPGRRGKSEDEFLSRPRFLAISEFGPRSIVYHEGSRYFINKVNLPVGEDDPFTSPPAKICKACGYLHASDATLTTDRCERCGDRDLQAYPNLLRLSNVSTRRRDRISSDEEERLRLGYELKTTVRFTDHGAVPTRRADVRLAERPLASLAFGQAATIWRMNLGWTRRSNKAVLGFVIDKERGYWQKDQSVDDAPEDSLSAQRARVIPYVDDRKNCLLFEPHERLSTQQMASLQAALKHGIQVLYQLEENELAVESLPTDSDRRVILFYEAAEGGAGVLRRLVDDTGAFPAVARQALEICHFDSAGADLGKGPRARETCEAACYDCLLSYSNQRDHAILDRHLICDLLLEIAQGTVHVAPGPRSRQEHLAGLERLCDSGLERQWLRHLDDRGLRLPTRAQVLLEALGTRPDFLYDEDHVAIYVDGPHHTYPERQKRDQALTEALEDAGYTVLRFGLDADWDALIARFPAVFGSLPPATRPAETPGLDLDLFEDRWHPLLKALSGQQGVTVRAGGDVAEGGKVIGCTLAIVESVGRRLTLLDGADPGVASVGGALERAGERVELIQPDDVDTRVAHIVATIRGES